MKAMVVHNFGSPLEMRDIETPRIGSDEVLVRVKTCGICHTDLKIQAGVVPTVKTPRVMGHEVAGEVAEIGHEVSGVEKGDHVVLYAYRTCGVCYHCRIAKENLCSNLFRLGRLGFEIDGGYAEYVKAPARNAFKISERVPYEEAAVLPDAVVVPFHAIRKHVASGDDVVVIGLGGLGIHGLQAAKACGAKIIAATHTPEKVALAKNLGADETVNTTEASLPEEVKKFTGGKGADVVIDTVGIPKTLEQGLKSLTSGGRLVIIGYEYGQNYEISPQYVAYSDIQIVGSRGGTRQDLADAIKMLELGRIKPILSKTFPLSDANKALELLKKENPIGRIALKP